MTEPRTDDASLAAALAALAPLLDLGAPPAPPQALIDRTLQLAAAELVRAPALLPGVPSARVRLPVGFRRELAWLFAAALPALSLGLVWVGLVFWLGPTWLAAWIPASLALALITLQLLAGLSALGLVTASLPLLAHRRALFRMRGVPS